jgi:hypothetical protein
MTERARRECFSPSVNCRRGMTVLVVLALVSIALAMSFAIMRSQMTGVQVQANNARSEQARAAAHAGLSAAMRAMRLSGWSGVGTTLSASINATDSYNVSFIAGDDSLTAGSADYSDLPYRVTLLSTGTSADPVQSSLNSTYKVQAVMRLIPRQISTQPSNWSTMLSYTLYQLSNTSFYMAVPSRIEGPVRLQSGLNIADNYWWSSSQRSRYFSDLNLMRSGANEVQVIARGGNSGGSFTVSFNGATTGNISSTASSSTMQTALSNLSSIGSGNVTVSGGGNSWTVTFVGQLADTDVPTMTVNGANLSGWGANVSVSNVSAGIAGTPDCRPFSGPVSLPSYLTTSTNMDLLTNQLGVSATNVSVSAQSAPWLGSVSTYRLYPGGPAYNVAQLSGSVSNTTLTADPASNPLGLFYASSNTTFGNNVTITGSVITGADLTIAGTNVSIQPFELPALDGTTTPIRLPSVIALDDLHVNSGAQATIRGVVYVGDTFDVPLGSESTALAITGNVIVGQDVTIERRNEWKNYTSGQWDTYYYVFQSQLTSPTGTPFFPQFLQNWPGRSYVPQVTIKPDTATVVSQWQTLSNPVYAVKSGDSGLRWDLVRLTDRL